MTPEMIQGYNKMILTYIKSSQDMIEELELDVNGEDSQAVVDAIQDDLDSAAGLLLKLRNAGAAIEQDAMDAFNGLNRNIRAVNLEHNVGLLPRAIGDVPEPAGHQEAKAEEYDHMQEAAANDTDCDAIVCVIGLQEATLDCSSDEES